MTWKDARSRRMSRHCSCHSCQLPSLPLRVNLASVKAVASTLATIGFSHKSTFTIVYVMEKMLLIFSNAFWVYECKFCNIFNQLFAWFYLPLSKKIALFIVKLILGPGFSRICKF